MGKITFSFDDNNSTNELAAWTLNQAGDRGIFLLNDSPTLEQDVKMLQGYNQIVGNHTKQHLLMTNMSEEEFQTEVVDFQKKLEGIAGKVEYFVYPHNAMPVNQNIQNEIIKMFPYRLRGVLEDIKTYDNKTNEILRLRLPEVGIAWLEDYLEDNDAIVEIHGIMGEKPWDIDLNYFDKLIKLWEKYQSLSLSGESIKSI